MTGVRERSAGGRAGARAVGLAAALVGLMATGFAAAAPPAADLPPLPTREELAAEDADLPALPTRAELAAEGARGGAELAEEAGSAPPGAIGSPARPGRMIGPGGPPPGVDPGGASTGGEDMAAGTGAPGQPPAGSLVGGPGGGDAADEAPAAAGPVAVTTRLTPEPSSIGDRLTLEVSAAYPSGYRVNLPMGLDFAPLHLVSVEEGEPESTGQGLRKVFKVHLQHFAVGEARTPSFPLTYVAPDGRVETVRVPPHAFTVASLLANEADPKRQLEDPPISLEYPAERAELVIYASALALVLGFLAALLWRRLRRAVAVVIGPPPVPPHERALGALAELEGSNLLETGLYADYYVQLTEITKAYLEGRFGVEALDRTTDELRQALLREGARIAPLQPAEVIAFLQECDLVKFARFAPEIEAARGDLTRVRAIVEQTRPDLAPSTAAPASPGAPAAAGAAGASDVSEGTGPAGQASAEAGAGGAPRAGEEGPR